MLRNSTKQPSIFMHDNAPCHKAMAVMKFLKAEYVTVMDWPLKAQILILLRMCGRLLENVLKPEIQKQQSNYGMLFRKNGIRSPSKISIN